MSSSEKGQQQPRNDIHPCSGLLLAWLMIKTHMFELYTGKPATMSSAHLTNGAYPASNGNDGKSGTFFHTPREKGAWWRVDLESSHRIQAVNLTNRPGKGFIYKCAPCLFGYLSSLSIRTSAWQQRQAITGQKSSHKIQHTTASTTKIINVYVGVVNQLNYFLFVSSQKTAIER